jgi:hypothetical protein
MSEPRGRPFEPGNTEGRGRPRGSRNKAKSPVQELLEEYALPVTRKCIGQAGQGDMQAMRIVMDRIAPVRRDACIRIKLPRTRTVQGVALAGEKVMREIARGQITPAEGEKVMSALEIQARIIKDASWEGRIEKIEQDKAGSRPFLAA